MGYKQKVKERVQQLSNEELNILVEDETGEAMTKLVKGINELLGHSKRAIYISCLSTVRREILSRSDQGSIDGEFTDVKLTESLRKTKMKKPKYKVTGEDLLLMLIVTCFVLLAIFIVERQKRYNEVIENYRTEVKSRWVDELRLKAKLSDVQDENSYLKTLNEELNNKVAIITAFKDAGMVASDQLHIKELLELAEQAPYGSPFVGGHIVTSKFGVRDERWFAGNGVHNGVDLIPKDWKLPPYVLSTANGKIIDFGDDRGKANIFGKWILFENTAGTYRIKYAHLSKIFWQDLDNHRVKDVPLVKGTKLGVMGDTGLTRGAHLHMEMYVKNLKGEWVLLNPQAIINFL